jgi:NADPH:quinone reductase-like Zn-dependent oxidoreductase
LGVQRDPAAGHVIDFRTQRFEDQIGSVDLVFNMIGGEVQDRSWTVVKRGGRLVTIAGETEDAPDQDRAAAAGITATFFIVTMDRDQLAMLRDLALSGDVIPIVGRRLPLEEAARAFASDHRGSRRGKTAITMA